MTRRIVKSLFAASLLLASAPPAAAWVTSEPLCNGKIRAVTSGVNYRINRCSIEAGTTEEGDLQHAVFSWNRIASVSDRFSLVNGSSSCTVTTGDDRYDVALTDPDEIDGNRGMTKIIYHGCTFSWSDGNIKEADVFASNELVLGPLSHTSNTRGLRDVLMHEFGHVLGAGHENRGGSTMCTVSPTCGKVGTFALGGAQSNTADSILPDDVHFAARWHGQSGAGNPDLFASAHTLGPSFGQSSPSTTVQGCPGAPFTFGITHGNRGKADAPLVAARVVASTNSTISVSDATISSGVLGANRGGWFNNLITVAVPNLAPGDYFLGLIVDADNDLTEGDESNNGVSFHLKMRILQGC